jgi:receptor protein-tyrosine kinase
MNIIEKAMQAEAARRRAPVEPAAAVPDATTGVAPVPGPAAPGGVTPVPFSGLGATGFLGPDPKEQGLLSELRHLKRGILQAAFGALAESGANIIMITSPMPEAGKTFLSTSLAQAMALERDRTTLLIDADDARSTLSRALGRHGQLGLFDLLHDRSLDPSAVIQPTDLPGLSFMTAGGQFADSLELLTSIRALEVFTTLAQADPNRLIVVDCPPLLGTPNGAALASLAGQTLVVVEAGSTDAVTLNKALELLNRERPLGIVLNKVPRSGMLSAGSGGYYYYAPTRE